MELEINDIHSMNGIELHEIEKNYLELLTEKPNKNSATLNKDINVNILNKLNIKIKDLIDIISNNLQNGYKPLYLGKNVEYTFYIQPDNTIKTFEGKIISKEDIKKEVENRITTLYNKPIIQNIEVINPHGNGRYNYYFVYGKFADQADDNRWFQQFQQDLKQLKSNPLEKLDNNKYKLNIFNQEFTISFSEQDYGKRLSKLNMINNQYQQFKYLEYLLINNKIILS